MTFDQCLISLFPKLAKKETAVEIWAGRKVGLVFRLRLRLRLSLLSLLQRTRSKNNEIE